MAVSTHLATLLMKAQGSLTAGQAVNFATDTFQIAAVVAGSGLPNLTSTGTTIQFLSTLLASNAENTNGAWPRTSLGTVTWAFDGSNTAVDWGFPNVTYAQSASDTGTATRYLVVYDSTVGAGDSSHPVVCVIDPGTTLSLLAGSLTIQSPVGGLIQFTGGG